MAKVQLHYVRLHLPEDEAPYRCTICERRFMAEKRARRHARKVHEDEDAPIEGTGRVPHFQGAFTPLHDRKEEAPGADAEDHQGGHEDRQAGGADPPTDLGNPGESVVIHVPEALLRELDVPDTKSSSTQTTAPKSLATSTQTERPSRRATSTQAPRPEKRERSTQTTSVEANQDVREALNAMRREFAGLAQRMTELTERLKPTSTAPAHRPERNRRPRDGPSFRSDRGWAAQKVALFGPTVPKRPRSSSSPPRQ